MSTCQKLSRLVDNDVDLSDIKLTSRWQLVALNGQEHDFKIYFLTNEYNGNILYTENKEAELQ